MPAIGAQPVTTRLLASVGRQTHFAGTIHDDAPARQFGYRGALVPGIWLLAQMCNLAVQAWGLDWVTRGSAHSRSRRPAYDGQPILLQASSVREDAEGRAVDFVMTDEAGAEVARGGAALPAQAPAPPDLAEYPEIDISGPRPVIEAGGFKPGDRFATREELITTEMLAESLAHFRQEWPGYAEGGIAHPTLLQRFATRHAIESYKVPTPTIFAAGAMQHFAPVHVGDVVTTAGVIRSVYERKGSHYYESDHVVIANHRTVVAHVRRNAIYAARRAA